MGLKLLEARIPILAFEQCRELGSNYAIFLRQEHHLCAGDPVTAHTDTCRVRHFLLIRILQFSKTFSKLHVVSTTKNKVDVLYLYDGF